MGVFGDELTARAGKLIARCRAKHLMLATVESCHIRARPDVMTGGPPPA